MRKELRMLKASLIAKAVFVAFVMVPLIGHSQMQSKAVVRFTGQEIRDDQQTGLTVSPSKRMPFIAVGSSYHDFTLLLPYSETWELESGTQVALFAKDEYYIASLNIGVSPIRTPLEYYEKFLENMKKSGEYETQKIEIIKIPNSEKQILRYQARKALLPEQYQHMNRWLWNYWMAVRYGSEWYALHISVLNDDEERLRQEERKVLFALDSLSPGTFKRKPADISHGK